MNECMYVCMLFMYVFMYVCTYVYIYVCMVWSTTSCVAVGCIINSTYCICVYVYVYIIFYEYAMPCERCSPRKKSVGMLWSGIVLFGKYFYLTIFKGAAFITSGRGRSNYISTTLNMLVEDNTDSSKNI